MPEMTPVATQIQPIDPSKGINTLSGILGLQQQRQALQTGQYQQATAQAESQQAQQKNAELKRARAIAMQGAQSGQYDDGDGGLDRQKMANDILKVAPTYGQAVIGDLLSQASSIASTRSTLNALTADQNKQLSGVMQGIAGMDNPSSKDILEAVGQARSNNRDPAFNRALDNMLMGFRQEWDGATIKKKAGDAASYIGGFSQQKPTMVEQGGQSQPGTVNQFSGAVTPAGNPIAKTLPPQVVTSPMTGGQAVVGGAQGTQPSPIGGGGQNPWQPYAGQQRDIETFRNEVQNVRQEAQQAPLARNINAQILRLSQDARTGPGSDVWQHVIGAVGAPFGLSPTSSYQEVGKFLEKNAIAAMQAMGGPPSDSRLEAAAKANGGTSFSPEALQTVTKFNDATNTALDKYRQGIDHTVGMGGNVDYTKLPAFKAAWAKNFDVDVFRVENAIRDGDKAELGKITRELGPERLKALAEKRRNLEALSRGEMP